MINILPRINKTGKRPLMIKDAEEWKVIKMKEKLRIQTEQITVTTRYNRRTNHLNNSGL